MKKTVLIISAFAILLTACTKKQQVDFSFELPKETSPVEISFSNKTTGATSYYWDFGDGNTSTEVNPKHTFNYWGTYNITLSAYNSEGEVVNSIKPITLRKPERRIVEIETDYGIIKAELFNFTPKHRDNFIKLAEEGYYDGTLFHRIMQGFMVQGGDPDSKNATAEQALGQGGPDYTIPAEIVSGAYHFKGALAAARQPDQVNPERASSGSQFYIVHGTPNTPQQLQGYVNQKSQRGMRVTYSQPQVDYYGAQGGSPVLDMEYTVFGQVIEGLHLIDKLATVPTGQLNRPVRDLKMKVRVIK
jgi:peptidyl-prolyl cis-trans isomerase B (cyclophilin B)